VIEVEREASVPARVRAEHATKINAQTSVFTDGQPGSVAA